MAEQSVNERPSRRSLPLVLIRGFGGMGVEDEKRIAYQGFNDGTVYPGKRGENYIYEGLILRFMKSRWAYHDATNVVGYYSEPAKAAPDVPGELNWISEDCFTDSKVVIDPAMALALRRTKADPRSTLWVFRYYDLNDRTFRTYGAMLVRLIDFIRQLTVEKSGGPRPLVNIIAHSMGGLLVREAVQRTYPDKGLRAEDYINKIVTLGTPHRGISFQLLRRWIGIDAEEELTHFSPSFQADSNERSSYLNFGRCFPVERLLTVVGTNYSTFSVGLASAANRMFSWPDEGGPNYNRSDGLVKQTSAQIPGAPRTFVHKCHAGLDSLVTSREAFEVATRFFFGNLRVRLRLLEAKITRGQDWFGKSEFFIGVCIKPRRVDFELFHQSAEAENCYGPFHQDDLSDTEVQFSWADDRRLIWEGYLDTSLILDDPSVSPKDLVLRLDFYVGERDLLGVGFSDNVIFRKQYYVRALLTPPLTLYLHTDESFAQAGFQPSPESHMAGTPLGWAFEVASTGFRGRLQIEIDEVPEDGQPVALKDVAEADA